MELKWFIVAREEWNGWDCSGHIVNYIVAASSPEEAETLLKDSQGIDEVQSVRELGELPDLKRKKKPFIWI